MVIETVYKLMIAAAGVAFVIYGMDIRRKAGACNFVGPIWLVLMKALSFALIGTFFMTLALSAELGALDWLTLALLLSGTLFVALAKRALGTVHTFTGQYLLRPGLVTTGVYSLTRNPLYFGVFQCELGASIYVAWHAPTVYSQHYIAVLLAGAVALAYVVGFNWTMARREAEYLETYFGVSYRDYRARVPFLIPLVPVR